MVVEEKRGLIEPQMKDALYGAANAPLIVGKADERGAPLFRVAGALEANHVAVEIGRRLLDRGAERVRGPLERAQALQARLAATTSLVERKPLLLRGLPALVLDRGAGGRARRRRHRLPLHGRLHGPPHRGLHPHGRRGSAVDRRGAVRHPPPPLPEHRRRHLQPFRLPRDSRRGGRGRDHHLQDPLQRRRRHDRGGRRTTAGSTCRGSPRRCGRKARARWWWSPTSRRSTGRARSPPASRSTTATRSSPCRSASPPSTASRS